MKSKKLGIWMDHDHAHLVEFDEENLETKTVPSHFENESRENHVTHGERHDLARHTQHRNEYFKALGQVIRNYPEVLLFGPTTAKSELLNILSGDHQFSRIRVQVAQADKMTENQMCEFVQHHFSKD
jgi:hypothetical protein